MNRQSLDKLSDTLDRYAASTLSSIAIPEFSGSLNEDVHDFVRKFKLSTLTLSDELRCLALNKALVNSARIWAKANLKAIIQAGDWKAAKKAIVSRFASPDQELRHQEKLNKMRFNQTTGSLTSYAEEYSHCYRRAHPNATDQEIIKSLSLNLPPNIIRNLNILSENWSQLTTITELYAIIKRLEYKILPYESTDDKEDKVGLAELTRIIKEMKETINVQQPKQEASPPANSDQAVAAVGGNPQQFPRSNKPGFKTNSANKGFHPYKPSKRNKNWIYAKRYNAGQGETANSNNNENSAATKGSEEVKAAYYTTYGKPPGPCRYCEEDHFNRHCPYKALN